MACARAAALALLAALAACSGSTPERLARREMPSPSLAEVKAYEVWAPRDLGRAERLPLVVFLHGGGDSADSFDQHRVGQHLDRALAAGRIPRAVIVVPDGDLGFWENWHDGSRRYRDWVVDEVVPAVQAEFHTLSCPEHCHVAGVSMGGHGTMRIAWFRPESFASAASLSGPILKTEAILEFADRWYVKLFIPVESIWGPLSDVERIRSEDLFRQWTDQEDLGVRLLLGVAKEDRDDILRTNREFHEHLLEHGIEHAYLEFEGEHGWDSWTPVIDRVLRFAVWGSVEPRRAAQNRPTTAAPVPMGTSFTGSASRSSLTVRDKPNMAPSNASRKAPCSTRACP
jgi:enterochelin esterase-like enzyme